MLIWRHKYLLFDGAGSGQGSRIQFNGLKETPNSKIVSLSGSFVNLDAWNWHCPGHELSPRIKENYMKPYAFSEIFTRRIEI